MPKWYWDVDQGSGDWHKLRAVIPTASCFDQIMTPKKCEPAAARWKYACRIVAARILNWQAESLDTIAHIAAGKEGEPLAIGQLEITEDIETQRVGFVTTQDGRFGASPDRVAHVAADRQSVGLMIEVKAPTIPKQFEYLLLPWDDAYKCQVQGQLFVGEADKALFYSYNPRMPVCRVETGRDEPFIRKLDDCLERFSDELEEMTERARRLGTFQAFEELGTPLDAERAPQMAGDLSELGIYD